MVVIGDQVAATPPGTVAWFAAGERQVKVVSGDHPRPIGAVASGSRIAGADHPVDARLPCQARAELAGLTGGRLRSSA